MENLRACVGATPLGGLVPSGTAGVGGVDPTCTVGCQHQVLQAVLLVRVVVGGVDCIRNDGGGDGELLRALNLLHFCLIDGDLLVQLLLGHLILNGREVVAPSSLSPSPTLARVDLTLLTTSETVLLDVLLHSQFVDLGGGDDDLAEEYVLRLPFEGLVGVRLRLNNLHALVEGAEDDGVERRDVQALPAVNLGHDVEGHQALLLGE
mmetsp:Transcript_5883/g.10043  ORF Transcript_5883/g.10043 Transcript_5883/m.10043 type:complete len:207 (+) Transcript_5883:838-1458(+)